MKKPFFCLVVFCLILSAFCDTPTVQQFETIKSDVISDLTSLQYYYGQLASRMDYYVEGGLQEYADILEMATVNPNDQYYAGMVSAAQDMKVWLDGFTGIKNDVQAYNISLGNTIAKVASLSVPTNAFGVDLSGVIAAIDSNRTQTVSAINHSSYSITNSLNYNTDRILSRIDLCVSNLQAVVDAIHDIQINGFPGSGGGGGSSVDLSTIEQLLQDIVYEISFVVDNTTLIQADVSTLLTFFVDSNGVFQKYLSLVRQRLESPDSSLSSDLLTMWQYCVEEMTNIVYSASRYSLNSQTFPVRNDIGVNGVRLSNEGLIALDNLAFNQRQYLCSIEMLNQLKGMNTTNNLSWITNYLDTIQKPYYELFNKSFLYTVPYRPYYSTSTRAWTNFIARVYQRDSLAKISNAYKAYHDDSQGSNYFYRIENLLMTLNGLFPTGLSTDVSEFEDATSDKENVSRLIEYSTNAVYSISDSVQSMSNSVSAVFSKFFDLSTAFHPDASGSDSGGIQVLPSFEFGGIQFEHVNITYTTLAPVVEPCRTVFSAIWWCLIGFTSFTIFLRLLRGIGAAVLAVQKLLAMLLQ